MEQAAVKEQVINSVHKIQVEINRVEHKAIGARKVLEQHLKGFETAKV